MSNGMEGSANSAAPRRGPDYGAWMRAFLILVLFGVIVLAGMSALRTMHARDAAQYTQSKTVESTGLIVPVAKGLSAAFTDRQGRLLADPEREPAKWVDPQVLVFAHITGSDPENPSTDWTAFQRQLEKATGRAVKMEAFDNSADQLAEIAKGTINLVALHAADSPFLVNTYGFEPVAVLGGSKGANGNHLDIIVPADSSIHSPADLKGHSLVCTVPTSITGYRAAVALLMQNDGLRPNVDYFITWSMGQKRSINALVKKQYEAAAVSDDKLQSMLDDGEIDQSEFRVIYQSEVIPRTTIGYFYNLKPDLAAKVTQAILSFDPGGASTRPSAGMAADSDESTTGEALRFIPVDYRKDFQLVRAIDDSFDPRLDAKKTHTGDGGAKAAAVE